MIEARITPCLWFDDDLEDAVAFYTSVFPRSEVLRISRYGDAGPGEPGTAMGAEFVLDGVPFRALNGGPQFPFTEAVSFSVTCADQEEVDHYWTALADGGEESMCGWLKDRFGLSWQIVPTGLYDLIGDQDPVRAQAAMAAMLGMRRIDLAAIGAAADQAARSTGV